jgi:FAD-dependent halogenase
MSDRPAYDLVVIGGGPAGSTVSALVAAQGHRVLLLERERFPRHQIGESLLPATVHGVCKLLGVDQELERANFVVKRGGVFRWGKRSEPWTFEWSHHPMLQGCSADWAYQVERAKFDEILLRNAERKGVVVREEAQVSSTLEAADGRVAGVRYRETGGDEKTVSARFVVDASGHTSPVAGRVGERVYSKFFQNVAMYGYFEGGKRSAPPREGNIICAAFDKGWFWYIPLSKTLTSVGAVIGREHADRLKGDRAAALAGLIEECPYIRDYLSAARRVTEGMYGQVRIRKDYSYTTSRFWIPGLALIGDAACFIDPVFSSGVHLATYAGLLAARSINTCLRGGADEAACFREFESRYRREFRVFYEFLIRFYDMNAEEDAYFWDARSLLNTEEAANEAFMRLVAGAATTGPDFFRSRANWLENDMRFRANGGTNEERPIMVALRAEGKRIVEMAFNGSVNDAGASLTGLAVSSDRFHWEPARET